LPQGANFNKIFEHCSHLFLFSLEPKINGEIGALDRLPRPELLRDAQVAAEAQGGELLICFGGNGRSSGFSGMVRSDKARRRFVKSLVRLCDKHGLHGVDYNWEYPVRFPPLGIIFRLF
jgi:GH18 family chitinase